MKIKNFIIKNFDIKKEEYQKFWLLLLHSFFVGLFIAFYFLPANSLFIANFGYEQLPPAYIVAGLAGYLITSLYSFLQKRVRSRSLFFIAILFMILISVISRLALTFTDDETIIRIPLLSHIGFNYTSRQWLYGFVFAWGWPFISLAAIELGGLVIRFLNLQQVKRMYGLINLGGVIASILGYLIIPLLSKVLYHSYDLFFLGAFSLLISIFILLLLYKRTEDHSENRPASRAERKETKRIPLVPRDNYLKLIFLSATLSAMVIYFSDFAWLSGIKAQKDRLPTPESISNFIAIVFGGLKIGELIISLLSSRLISRHGVKMGLSVLPFVSSSLILLAAIFGAASGHGALLFFVMIVLNKSFERILRRGLDDPSFNILYQPLPENERLSIQIRVGVIMQLSIALAGVFLIVSNLFLVKPEGYLLKYYPLFLLPLLVGWWFITRRLYEAYKAKIKTLLEESNKLKLASTQTDIYGSDLLEKQLANENIDNRRLSTTILSETNPSILESYVVSLLDTHDETILKSVLRNIVPGWPEHLKNQCIEISEIDDNKLNASQVSANIIKKLAKKASYYLDNRSLSALDEAELDRIKDSTLSLDKLELLKYLFINRPSDYEAILLDLLDNKKRNIRISALRLCERGNISTKVIKRIAELLHDEQFQKISAYTLVKIGPTVLEELHRIASRTDITHVLSKVTEIYGRIGTPEAQSYLLRYLSHPDRDIQLSAIRSLYYCHYQANDTQSITQIKEKIKETVENILWIFISISDIEAEKNTLKLIQALDLERERNFDVLFQLLSLIYQPATIDLIRTNVIGENIIYALEIIDNFIEQEVSQLLSPIIDKLSVAHRIKKLKNHFDLSKLPFDKRLTDIVNKPDSRVDIWTKTKALELLAKVYKRRDDEPADKREQDHAHHDDEAMSISERIQRAAIPDDVFNSLMHPDELVYSTAAQLIYEEDPDLCFDYLESLPNDRQALIQVLDKDHSELLNERVKYIKRVPGFFGFPEVTLVKLARLFKTRLVQKKEVIGFTDENKSENIFIVVKGNLIYRKHDGSELNFGRNDTIVKGLDVDENAEELIAKSNTLVLMCNRFLYFNLLVDETEIIKYMFAAKKARRPGGKKRGEGVAEEEEAEDI